MARAPRIKHYLEGVRYKSDSCVPKIGEADATYAALVTCPSYCAFRGSGCYAEEGNVGVYTRKYLAPHATPDLIGMAMAEARAIDASYKGGPVPAGRPLRLHISGDCSIPEAASIVSAAVRRRTRRGGGPTWAYTHAWPDVPRSDWRGVSVLASIERPSDAAAARARGYAPALVISRFPDGAKPFEAAGITWIPCPAQAREGRSCSGNGAEMVRRCKDVKTLTRACRLCWNDRGLLQKNYGIAFEAHGSGETSVRRRLLVLQ